MGETVTLIGYQEGKYMYDFQNFQHPKLKVIFRQTLFKERLYRPTAESGKDRKPLATSPLLEISCSQICQFFGLCQGEPNTALSHDIMSPFRGEQFHCFLKDPGQITSNCLFHCYVSIN
jgi:hypothetical protein